ncbi:MAG: hypothetical protein ACXAE3_06605 [Candidatus Kariarchaeaceae archaeon]|jgi:hypothetical protein
MEKDSNYNELIELYNEIVESLSAHTYIDRVPELKKYYTNGNLLSRLRSVEALLDIYDSMVTQIEQLVKAKHMWEKYEKEGGELPVSTFFSSAGVISEIRHQISILGALGDSLWDIVQQEKDNRIVGAIRLFFTTRHLEHTTGLDSYFDRVEKLYSNPVSPLEK